MQRDSTLLDVKNLRTYFFLDEGVVRAVDDVSFAMGRSGVLGVVGESGCGKSVLARSIMRIVRPPGRTIEGEILYYRPTPDGASDLGADIVDLAELPLDGPEIREIRGGDITMVFQEPMVSFSPVHTIGNQIIESILLHQDVTKQEARNQAIETLRRVGIPNPESRVDEYPFRLSGGMRQRAMIALALSCNPNLLIADEPTTALDVTTQAQILDLMTELQQEYGMAMMLITHNLGVVAQVAEEVIVMYLGKVVERADVKTLFRDPKHPYTQELLKSIPQLSRLKQNERLTSITGNVPPPFVRPSGCPFHPRCPMAMPGCVRHNRAPGADGCAGARRKLLAVFTRPQIRASGVSMADGIEASTLLEVKNLKVHFPIISGLLRRTTGYVRAVDDASFDLRDGETLALVGESGCGKTTTGRAILRAVEPTAGDIIFRMRDDSRVNTTTVDSDELRLLRQEMQFIFQDPFASLNPRMTVFDVVGDPLRVNHMSKGKELEDRVTDMLRLVGLSPEYARRYPHAFSGGQRQRIGIARALVMNPRLVIADEPVSALDVSVQAQILNLMQDLQEQLKLTYLFISHDLSVVQYISHRVAVMYVGKIVELAPTEALFTEPKHPYTQALLSSVPVANPGGPVSRRAPGR